MRAPQNAFESNPSAKRLRFPGGSPGPWYGEWVLQNPRNRGSTDFGLDPRFLPLRNGAPDPRHALAFVLRVTGHSTVSNWTHQLWKRVNAPELFMSSRT